MGIQTIFKGLSAVFPKSFRLGFHIQKRHANVLRNIRFSSEPQMIFEENKAYFTVLPEEEKFQVLFLYQYGTLKPTKPLCVVRPITDTVETFLEKLDHKVLQLLEKKLFKKKKVPEVVELPTVKSSILHKEGPIQDIACKNLFEGNHNGEYKLKITENEYDVLINSPWVSSIKLTTNPYSRFFIFPNRFEGTSVDLKLTDMTWYKSDLNSKNNDWTECGKGYFYKIKDEDIGNALLLIVNPRNEYLTGPTYQVMSKIILPFELKCPFEDRHIHTQSKTRPDEIRIVSYNILADVYAETKDALNTLFSYCKIDALAADYRKQLILRELEGYNADIICLQEVDAKLYNRCFRPFFNDSGFESEFYEKGGAREGTAVFFDTKKFKMIKSLHHVLSDDLEKSETLKDLYDKVSTNEALLVRLRRLGTTLQILVLESLVKPNELIVIGNTHLYFHPDADHIRLLQGIMCMKLLDANIKKVKNEVNYYSLNHFLHYLIFFFLNF